MRRRWTLVGAGVLACALSRSASAQGGIALVPYGGFGMPGTMASESNGWEFKPKGAGFVGLQIELGASKTLGIGVGGNYSFGQSLDVNNTSSSGGGTVGTADITSLLAYGMLVLRPGGHLPSGAVTPLGIELGGGIRRWNFDKFIVQNTTYSTAGWNSSEPFAFAGVDYNVPIGPRASLQIMGRAIGGFGYSSRGLDDFNAAPPASNAKGKFNIGFQVGAGLRVGR